MVYQALFVQDLCKCVYKLEPFFQVIDVAHGPIVSNRSPNPHSLQINSSINTCMCMYICLINRLLCFYYESEYIKAPKTRNLTSMFNEETSEKII